MYFIKVFFKIINAIYLVSYNINYMTLKLFLLSRANLTQLTESLSNNIKY